MKLGTLNFDSLATIVDALGAEKIEEVLNTRYHRRESVSYGEIEIDQLAAGLDQIFDSLESDWRQETFLAVARGEKRVRIVIEDVLKPLFDRFGMAIPDRSIVTSSFRVKPRPWRYHHHQTLGENHDFSKVFDVWQSCFQQDPGMTAWDFRERVGSLKREIQQDSNLRNLLGPQAYPCYPILLPKIRKSKGGYGSMLQRIFIPAAQKSYSMAFPEKSREVRLEKNLSGKVIIVDEGHERLVQDLYKKPILGLICYPFLHFSINAQRQFAKQLPSFINLAGAIEVLTAETMFPQHLLNSSGGNYCSPSKQCSAIEYSGKPFSDSDHLFNHYCIQTGYGKDGTIFHAGYLPEVEEGRTGALFIREEV